MFKLFARIAYTIVVFIQGLIVLRFVILLFNVKATSSLIKWILDNSNTFVSPFNGVLETSTLSLGSLNLDLTSIVAFFFYMILGFVTIEIVKAFSTD